MRALAVVGFGVLAMSWSCAYAPPPVVMDASAASLNALAGDWRGEFTSTGRGGTGSIVFTLVPGEDHAHGDVLMIPEGSYAYEPYRAPEPQRNTRPPGYVPQILTIRFVRVADGAITGTLARYWDPDRECAASATFHGRLDGDTIDGTFRSICEGGALALAGRWTVGRQVTRER